MTSTSSLIPPGITPPTFPARPMNGGKLEHAWAINEPDLTEWGHRPKINGKRVLVHVPTLRTWNRLLEETDWGRLPVFRKLRQLCQDSDLWPPVLEWLDCELMGPKGHIARNCLVVLDYPTGGEVWWDRMCTLRGVFDEDHLWSSVYERPAENEPHFLMPLGNKPDDILKVWLEMQGLNKEWGRTVYEGLVAYEMRSRYPVQLFNPKQETRHWVKHRFIY